MKSNTNIYIVLGASAIPFLISIGCFLSDYFGYGVLFLVIALGLAVFGIIRSVNTR
jgi:predicted membrane channel-forming protein YqfA (hemolysin III family)